MHKQHMTEGAAARCHHIHGTHAAPKVRPERPGLVVEHEPEQADR
jgi:hypothetical protein